MQGNSKFPIVSQQTSFYCDKTLYIKKLEEKNKTSQTILFLRPRRFGKSLFLSTLDYFHNLKYKNQYQELFGHLQIGKEDIIHNSYMVLLLDFSCLNCTRIDRFETSMNNLLNDNIKKFKRVYCDMQNIEQIVVNNEDSISSFRSLWHFVEIATVKLYVLIDEYDTQVNAVLSNKDSALQKHLLETNGDNDSMKSTYRIFFSELKSAMSQLLFMRIFITGVAPMALQAFTSGFNIQLDITHELNFAGLCGITEVDVDRAINSLKYKDKKNLKKLIIDNYNGYCFHPKQSEELINPTLLNYLMSQIQTYGEIPRRLIENNVSISDNAVTMIINNHLSGPLIKKMIENPFFQMNFLIDDKVDFLQLIESEKSLVQYLYYLGGLTHLRNDDENKLKIPNKIALNEYFTGIMNINQTIMNIESISAFEDALKTLIDKKNIKLFCDFVIEHKLVHLRYNDVEHSKEQDMKGVFLFSLSLGGYRKNVENEYYIPKYNKYLNLFITYYNIHFEFKNITTDELNLTKSKDWAKRTKISESLKKKTQLELFQLKVTSTFQNQPYVSTVSQIWNLLLEQTKENKRILEEVIKTKVTSFSVLRVGLYVLIFDKIV